LGLSWELSIKDVCNQKRGCQVRPFFGAKNFEILEIYGVFARTRGREIYFS